MFNILKGKLADRYNITVLLKIVFDYKLCLKISYSVICLKNEGFSTPVKLTYFLIFKEPMNNILKDYKAACKAFVKENHWVSCTQTPNKGFSTPV